MRKALLLVAIAALVGCNTSSSSEWREIEANSKEARFERAKAICNGRAAETQAVAGRLWIAGAIAADSSFKGCMAQQGFTQ